MENSNRIPEIFSSIPLRGILGIDIALEGDWSPTVVKVWSRDSGSIGFTKVVESHPLHKPSIELYFQDFWLGIHCFTRENDVDVFDKSIVKKWLNMLKLKLDNG